jgi:hypothetical protein
VEQYEEMQAAPFGICHQKKVLFHQAKTAYEKDDVDYINNTLKKNSAGYNDPTAYEAIANVMKEQRRKRDKGVG